MEIGEHALLNFNLKMMFLLYNLRYTIYGCVHDNAGTYAYCRIVRFAASVIDSTIEIDSVLP